MAHPATRVRLLCEMSTHMGSGGPRCLESAGLFTVADAADALVHGALTPERLRTCGAPDPERLLVSLRGLCGGQVGKREVRSRGDWLGFQLWVAAARGDRARVCALLREVAAQPREGADEALQWHEHGRGRTAVLMAVCYGHHEVLRALLEAGASPSTPCRDGDGTMSPLHAAVRRPFSDLRVVRMLLGAGAALNWSSQYGMTAMSLAAKLGHVEVLRELLAAGASPHKRAMSGRSAIFFAVQAKRNSVECVRLLLERRVDLHMHTHLGGTVLHEAATERNLGALELLLQHSDVDVNATTLSGQTALSIATWRGDVAAMEMLWRAGAKLFVRERSGETNLSRACTWNLLDAGLFLVERGVRTDITAPCSGRMRLPLEQVRTRAPMMPALDAPARWAAALPLAAMRAAVCSAPRRDHARCGLHHGLGEATYSAAERRARLCREAAAAAEEEVRADPFCSVLADLSEDLDSAMAALCE